MSDITSRPKNNKNQTKRRRNKKRRTADVSSSSDSDSDVSLGSDSDNEEKNKDDNEEEENEEARLKASKESDIRLSDDEDQDDVNGNDEDVEMGEEAVAKRHESHKRMNEIKLTDDLKEINSSANNTSQTFGDYNKISSGLETLDKELKAKYLQLTFEHYGEDINKLREASDFTNKSLVILANALKEGTRMFDNDSLKNMLE